MSQDNPFMKRGLHLEKQSKGYHRSSKQERQIAKRLGARLTPRSGAGTTKGDVIIPSVVRIEAKCTQAGSFRLTTKMIDTIVNASIACDEIPALIIEFLDTAGK